MNLRDRLAKRILTQERAILAEQLSHLLSDRQLEELGMELVDMADRIADAVLEVVNYKPDVEPHETQVWWSAGKEGGGQ